jgi:acyl-CoA synthetase (AMP-forming)/AMP-acid ligase II
MQVTDLLALIEAAAGTESTVRFLPAESAPMSYAQIWDRANGAAAFLHEHRGSTGRIGALLTSSSACTASILGTWRAGCELVSLPLPPRRVPLPDYVQSLDRLSRALGLEVIVCDEVYAPVLSGLSVDVVPFEACTRQTRETWLEAGGRLIQFTSGTTRDPQGVSLSATAIASNVTAILDRVQPTGEDVACSWLPLAHDMGLIGTLLTGWIGSGPGWAGRGGLVFIRPEEFLSDPTTWFQACSTYRATITAGPPFAYLRAAERSTRLKGLDLASLRLAIVGAERVRADVLRRVGASGRPLGLEERALSPAYGLAEATLAVSLVEAESEWHSVRLEDGAESELVAGRMARDEIEVVSCGRPLDGAEVTINEGSQGELGEFVISGPSLLDGYVEPNGRFTPAAMDGRFATADIGFLRDGELYPVTRSDDVLLAAGRKIFESEIAATAESVEGVRPGGCVALQHGSDYLLIAEYAATSAEQDVDDVCRAIRRGLARQIGIGPYQVILVEPGSVARTTSGKIRRRMTEVALERGELGEIRSHRFRGIA